MDINGGKHRDFLTGGEEVAAFERSEFIKLHKSTMCKVYFFQRVYNKLQERKLQTARTGFLNKVNDFLESTLAKIIGFVSVLFAIFQFVQAAYLGFPLPK